MTDRDALIAACLDRPADETPRLVLADWIDDHGDDAATLRNPVGYYTFSSPAVVGPPYKFWWHVVGAPFLIGEIPPRAVPRCVNVDTLHGCGNGRCRGFYFGEWRCLQCAARFATQNQIGIWEWMRREDAVPAFRTGNVP